VSRGILGWEQAKRPQEREQYPRPSSKCTYVISFLRSVEEEVIQKNRRERWQIIELKIIMIAGEDVMVYGRRGSLLKLESDS
jgi:hypothetical protein